MKASVSQRNPTEVRGRNPGSGAGEEPRREEPRRKKSEKFQDWSELQGEAGRKAHK